MINSVPDKKLYFAKVRENARIPVRKGSGNAGYDIYPCFDEDYITINPHSIKNIPTGIACAMNENYYMQIEERSSTGIMGMKKNAGVIDSSYRGEVTISIYNASNKTVFIAKDELEMLNQLRNWNTDDYTVYSYNNAIAQGIIHRVPEMDVEEIPYSELERIPSTRGKNWLGSTNLKVH